MANWSNVMLATQALVNRATSSSDLTEIARIHRSLWTEIAAHPKASDELLTWLAREGDMSVRALVTMRILRRDPSDDGYDDEFDDTKEESHPSSVPPGSVHPDSQADQSGPSVNPSASQPGLYSSHSPASSVPPQSHEESAEAMESRFLELKAALEQAMEEAEQQ